jgi:hypothetical protein
MMRWGGCGADDVKEADIPNIAHSSDPTQAASPSVLHSVLCVHLDWQHIGYANTCNAVVCVKTT